MNQPTTNQSKSATGQFDKVLAAWQDGKDVAWSELMAAWVKTPTAPLSPETVTKLIKHLDGNGNWIGIRGLGIRDWVSAAASQSPTSNFQVQTQRAAEPLYDFALGRPGGCADRSDERG